MKYKEMFVPSLIQLAVEVKNKEEAFNRCTTIRKNGVRQ